MATTLSGAVETSPVVSVHAFESTDPDAFEVPGGREEEWRFTPLRRLRALHKDAPPGRGRYRHRSRRRKPGSPWNGTPRPR